MKNHNNSSSTPQKLNNLVAEPNLEKKNDSLEKRVEELETSKVISENVSKQLANEVDRLSQYTRRSNVIVRNVFLSENESNEQINKKVVKIIKDELNLPNVVDDVDKLHRVGKTK